MSNTNYILTSNGNFISDDEFYHWGIKGMKWGVRRKKNKNGTLTKAGKKRYKPNKSDEVQFGKRGAQRIADRRNKGQSRSTAVAKEIGLAGLNAAMFTAIGGVAVMDYYSGGALHRAAYKAVVNAGKKAVDSYFNMEVLDASGKVLKRYRGNVEPVVEKLLSIGP